MSMAFPKITPSTRRVRGPDISTVILADALAAPISREISIVLKYFMVLNNPKVIRFLRECWLIAQSLIVVRNTITLEALHYLAVALYPLLFLVQLLCLEIHATLLIGII
jgi:hypothetical protein